MRNEKLVSVLCLLSSVLLALAASAARYSPMVLPPFTFVGRVSDYDHVAFDADQIAEVRAYTADGSTLIAKASTYAESDSLYNFRLDIPVSTSTVDGRVKPGTKVKIDFVDNEGRVFAGEVPADDAVVGNPGDRKRLTVILAEDTDKDGIPDEKVDYYLDLAWYRGYDLWELDAQADYDGDGQTTLAEYIAGTDPFDENDVFDVKALQIDFWPKDESGKVMEDYVRVLFLARNGRAYSLFTTPLLDDGNVWRLGTFQYQPTEESETASYLTTGGTETGWRWFYLKKDLLRRFWRLEVE